MAATKASTYSRSLTCRHTYMHYLRCYQDDPCQTAASSRQAGRKSLLSQVIRITEPYKPGATPARIPVPERAVPGCRTALPVAPGVPPSWRTQGGVTSLVFPQGSRFSREIPAGCCSAVCQDSALPLLSCPRSSGALGLSATGMDRTSQGHQGTWTCPQHPQARHLGTSNSRSQSALGWQLSPCPAAA